MDYIIFRSSRVTIISLVAAACHMFSIMPAHARTTCQYAQQQVDYYLKNPTVNQYCHYTVEASGSEVKIWVDCDYRPVTVKTYTYSPGGVDRTYSATVTCCYNTCSRPEDTYSDSYTTTYYKTSVTTEYCDGHTTTTEYNYGGYGGGYAWTFYSTYSEVCNSPGSSNLQTYVQQAATDCSMVKYRYLKETINIPTNCDPLDPKKYGPCYGSTDPCCDSGDPNCGKKYPCNGDPNCGELSLTCE